MTSKMTLADLIDAYQSDDRSTYQNLLDETRRRHDRMLLRLRREYGEAAIREIDAEMLRLWHTQWSAGGKIAMAHAMISQVRGLSTFGVKTSPKRETLRLKSLLSGMHFQLPKRGRDALTADQAKAVRAEAHRYGWPSIAIAQAFQFDTGLSQKDVIGAWILRRERRNLLGVVWDEREWKGGLRWEEIDRALVLRHRSSGNDLAIIMGLRSAPMVMEELHLLHEREGSFTTSGPIVICEATGRPWNASEFRRKRRMVARSAGVADTVKNMGSTSDAGESPRDAEGRFLSRHARRPSRR
jgi:hypothetical protein